MGWNARFAPLASLACAALLIACSTDDEQVASTDPSPTTVTHVDAPTTTSMPVATSTSTATSAPPPTTTPASTTSSSTTAPATIDGRTPLPWHDEHAFPAVGNPPQSRVEVDDAGCVRIGFESDRPAPTLWPEGWSAILDDPVRIFDETGTQVWIAGDARHVTQFLTEEDRFVDLLPPACREGRVILVGSVDPPLG